jgi:O-antigen/teichoic acid export membrane protein
MGLIFVLGFVQNLVLARLLGPAGLGHVSILMAALNIGILVGSGGLTTAILRHSAAQKQDRAGFSVYRVGMSFGMFSSIAAGAGLAAFSTSRFWPFDPVAGAWLPWAAASIPTVVFGTCSIAYLQSRDRMRDKAVLDFLRRAVLAIAIITGVALAGFPGFVAGHVVGSLLGAAVAGIRTWKSRPATTVACPISRRELFRFGTWSMLTQMLGFVLEAADLLCLSALLGDEVAVGLYGLAAVLQRFVRIPMLAYLDARFPALTRESATLEQARRVRGRMRIHILCIALVAAGAAAVAGPILVPWVFGADYSGSVLSLEILLVGQVLWSLGAAQGRSLLAAGWVEGNFIASIVAASVNLGANFLLIPIWGAPGAAMATAGTWGVWAVVVNLLSRYQDRRSL